VNIYQRLIEVKKAVPYLQKDKYIQIGQGGYKAISHDKVSSGVRDALNDQGIVPIPTVIGHTEEKLGNVFKASVVVEVTFVNAENPDEKVVCQMPGSALDKGDKAYGKAVSIATKYVYLKVLQIETGVNDEERVEPEQNLDKAKPEMVAVWRKRLSNVGIDEARFLKRVNVNLNAAYESLDDVSLAHQLRTEGFVQLLEARVSEEKKSTSE